MESNEAGNQSDLVQLVEECARTVQKKYLMTKYRDPDAERHQWSNIPDSWREDYRVFVRAVLDTAGYSALESRVGELEKERDNWLEVERWNLIATMHKQLDYIEQLEAAAKAGQNLQDVWERWNGGKFEKAYDDWVVVLVQHRDALAALSATRGGAEGSVGDA